MEKHPAFSRFFSLLAAPAALAALELLLRVTAKLPLRFAGAPGMLLTALAFGGLISLLALLTGSDRAGRTVGLVLLEALTVWFLIAYFTDNTYKVFMGAASVFGEAKNVVQGFSDTLKTVLVQGLPVILLYHVPALLWILFRKKLVFSGKNRWVFVLGLAVLSAAAGFGGWALDSRLPGLREKYKAEYTYDGSVRSFGLLTALELDVQHLASPKKAAEEIVFSAPTAPEPPVPQPEKPQEPTQPEPPAEQPPEEPEEPEAPVEYGFNVLELDFDRLISEAPDNTVRSIHEYVASLQPSRKNEYTGLFAGKNLILITAEAFTWKVIDPERTPTLYRLANNGICFEEFYQPAWGGSTSTGEFSFLMGTIPTTAAAIQRTIGDNLYFTMGNQLQRQGYFSRAYHNGDFDYYNRNHTHPNLGYSDFIAIGTGLEQGLTMCWPYSDLEMLEYTLPDYIGQQPFSVYYMTVSGHCNYAFSTSTNSMAAKNKDVVEGMEGSERVRAYYAANQELEYALTYLVQQLEDAGIADDTVIALCADHYPYGLERSTAWHNDRDYLQELLGYDKLTNRTRDRNAAIIWSGCLEKLDEPITVSGPCYSPDLLPTLSNLFGVDYDSRLLVGRDVLSDAEPLVIWIDYSWLTDKGYYNASNGVFTPNEGTEVEEGYVERMKEVVRNRMAFSKAVLTYDYYGLIFGEDEIQ